MGTEPLDCAFDIDEDLTLPVLTVVIGPDPPERLDKALVRDAPECAGLSRSRLQRLFEAGLITRGGQVLGPRARFAAGDVITITLPEPESLSAEPEPIPLEIVYEDEALLVVNKPAGMVVHPGPGNPRGTLVNALVYHCGAALSKRGGAFRPGLVHRIDKDTSGLLVVAKTDHAHQALAQQFATHSIDRMYWGLVHGQPARHEPRLLGLPGVSAERDGRIRIATLIDRHPIDRQRRAVVKRGGKTAVTWLTPVESFGAPAQATLCHFALETGRTHQIRVHASYLGHPLLGDLVYGGNRALKPGALSAQAQAALFGLKRQALHAARLGFSHPETGARLVFEAPLPQDLATLLDALRGQDKAPRVRADATKPEDQKA